MAFCAEIMIFFKKKPLVLDLFTNRQEIFDLAKPLPAKEFYPDWWKQTPKTLTPPSEISPTPSIKTCNGFIDQFQRGFIIPMWSDLNIELAPEGEPNARWKFSDLISEAIPHPEWQRGGFLPDARHFHLKLVAPWLAFCEEAVDFQLMAASWHIDRPQDMVIPSGILNFKYQNALNVNAFFTRHPNRRIHEIKFDDPLIHLVPLTERELILRHHMVDREEWMRLNSKARSIAFKGNYNIIKKKMSCPFH